MRMIFYFAYLIGTGITSLLTWKLYSVFFSRPRAENDTVLLCFCLYFTLRVCLHQFAPTVGTALAGQFLLLALLALLYQDRWVKKLFCVLSLFLFRSTVHYGLLYISGRGHLLLFQPDRANAVIGIALECIALYLFYAAVNLVRELLHRDPIAITDWTLAFLVPLCLAFLLGIFLIRNDPPFSAPLFFFILTLATINLIALILYWQRAVRTQLALAEYQNRSYQNQLDLIAASESAFRRLRHDLKNHLVVLSRMLDEAHTDQASAYLAALGAELDTARSVSGTGNTTVDSLINYKLHGLDDLGIRLDYQAQIPAELHIAAFDLAVILGNLLDNAREALAQQPASEEKQLTVRLRYDRGRLILSVSNTYDGTLLTSASGLRTRKADSARHGIGLDSVRAVVEKYNGVMKLSHDQTRFSVQVILYEPLADHTDPQKKSG